jgi:uncharacterized membrane protein YgdD (TMEM256/DUF423 family)
MNRLQAGAALLGFISVAFGAFGAHAMDGRLSDEAAGWWQTATLYGLVHAGVVLALSTRSVQDGARWAGELMLIGAFVFCGTLYAMGLGAPRWLGAITPMGGLMLLLAWSWLMIAAMKRPRV